MNRRNLKGNAPSQKKKEELSAAEALTSLCRSPSNSADSSPVVTQNPPQHQHETTPFLLPSPANCGINVHMPPLTIPAADFHQHDETVKKNELSRKTFPQKLFDILENPEHSDILKWLPGGKAFIIMDKKRFACEILPVYFKQTQFTSFTRKLSRWKFVRVPRGPYLGAYYHKLFRKDHKALCRLMSCNNEVPSLAVLAQVRQEAIDSAAASAPKMPAVPQINLSLPQQTALQKLEEMKKIAMLKEQLLQIRLQRAQLYEHQKRILMGYGSEAFAKNANKIHSQQMPANLLTSVYGNSAQQQPLYLNNSEINVSQMAKLRQIAMMNPTHSMGAHFQPLIMPQQLQGTVPQGYPQQPQSRKGWEKNCFRASAA